MTNCKKIAIARYPDVSGKQLLNTIVSARIRRDSEISESVNAIIEQIRTSGDKGLCALTKKFDNVSLSPKSIRVQKKEIISQAKKVNPALKKAIDGAADRITAYHQKQHRKGFSLKTQEGTLSQLIKPLNRVGLYIPGGHTIYPSSVLMNAIPAIVAGVKEIAAVTPPRKEIDPGVAYALSHLGIYELYRVGGSQSIAALAYGTQSIKQVDKITGPGNSYVQIAKKAVYGTVDIDSIAGPSEVVILADTSANPSWIALDLLAQAEHGSGDEIAVCVTESMQLAQKIAKNVQAEIEKSKVRNTFYSLPEHAISIFVTKSRKSSISLVNKFAAEHLQIITKKPNDDLKEITNGSAIFIGPYTPVALGDYFIGTNHVLPTGGAARFSSPLGVESFQKRVSVANISKKGLSKAVNPVSTFARAENFIHHALSVERRVV